MRVNTIEIGKYIKAKRVEKHLTQKDIANLMHISFQAVSKWETGSTLPDTSLLLQLSDVLEVTVDQILSAGEFRTSIHKKINVEEVSETLKSIPRMKDVLGSNNMFYNAMMNGVNEIFKENFSDVINSKRGAEEILAKSIVQLISEGYYITKEDIESNFKSDDIKEAITKYSKKYRA